MARFHAYFFSVTLLLDGERFTENERNPEILDDWPLHQTKQHVIYNIFIWHIQLS